MESEGASREKELKSVVRLRWKTDREGNVFYQPQYLDGSAGPEIGTGFNINKDDPRVFELYKRKKLEEYGLPPDEEDDLKKAA